MKLRRIFSPSLESNTSAYENPSTFRGEKSGRTTPVTEPTPEVRSIVQRRFMSMMEAHDRVRERLLGSDQASSYPE
ncbi:MAG: hypothetical protein AABN95_12885 [Acidobacteriota bacterium]